MSQITHIILHESASSFGDRFILDKWHKERGWPGIGYHYVICNGYREKGVFLPALLGRLQVGIPLDADNYIRGTEQGRHALGYNAKSIGICMIGEGAKGFALEQWLTLKKLLQALVKNHGIPVENILGHNETASGKEQGKTCPGFDVEAFRGRFKKEMGLS